ncbi:hypothetical protein HSBAA_39790 [Vreelandella sulfidaeris]|uniref:Carbohydrate kinase PfkB domain-containing protein n=1 Tax=Vreelandella sulfidaeris TaxID=115553 RepID=A0A455UBL6_9GAMM|nr:hypothetical protein HSBAA_39790 [Halomonas sulfidaeris]
MARVLCITLNPALDLAFNLDVLVPGSVNRPTSAQLEAAGKGVNVARVLAGLGHAVTVSGFLGADNGAPFELAFAKYSLTDAFVRVPGKPALMPKLLNRAVALPILTAPACPLTPRICRR